MKVAVLCFFLATTTTAASAYTLMDRRAAVWRAWGVAAASSTIMAIPPAPAQAILSSKYCASGTGDGCADLAQGNELIRSLQEKSAANRERNEKEARDAFYMKNYPDWFASVGKTLVKKSDGTFVALDDTEVAQLRKENKLTLEVPRAMGGQVVDYTQKPVLLLKE